MVLRLRWRGSNLNIGGTDNWTLHDDGSLRPNPERMEYVLARPIPRKEVSTILNELQIALARNSAKLNPSDRCGVHIHVNCQDLTPMQVISFISTYLILEEPMVKWCGEEREGNLFALRAKDAEWIISALIRSIQDGNFNSFNSEMRYSSVNVAAILKFGSLEFRALNTPKDFSVINTWVDMLMRIKDYSMTYKQPRDIVEAVSAGGFSRFPKQVLGDMAELIMCKGAAVMVSEGVRRVQEIAYADLIYKKKESQHSEVAQDQAQRWMIVNEAAPGRITVDLETQAAPTRWQQFVQPRQPQPPTTLPPAPVPPDPAVRNRRAVINARRREIERSTGGMVYGSPEWNTIVAEYMRLGNELVTLRD